MISSTSFRCCKVGKSSPCCVCYYKPSRTRQEDSKLSLSPNLYCNLFVSASYRRTDTMSWSVQCQGKKDFHLVWIPWSTRTDKPLKSWTTVRWYVWRWISDPHSYHDIGMPVRRNVYLADYFSLKVFTWFQCIISNLFDSFHTLPSTYMIVLR